MKWMQEEANIAGPTQLASKAVDNFPSIFIARNRDTNRRRVCMWLPSSVAYIASVENSEQIRRSITTRKESGIGVRRVRLKALRGRRTKMSMWKVELFEAMEHEFKRLRILGVKMNRHLVYQLALQLIADTNISVSPEQIEQAAGRPVEEVVNLNWVQTLIGFKKYCVKEAYRQSLFLK